IMTWSINWDSSQNNNSFARNNGAFLHSFVREGEVEVPTTQPPTTTKPEDTTTQKQQDTTSEIQTQNNTTTHVTEPETSQNPNVDVKLNVAGFQISNKNEGVRTVYTVSNKMGNWDVVESGIVYGLEGKVPDEQLFVGSSNPYVKPFASSMEHGLLSTTVEGDSSSCKSYAMTMTFGSKTMKALTAEYKIRLYAKLSNGAYVYSDEICRYSVYRVADKIYQSRNMVNKVGHDYLYNEILKKVNSSYEEVEYDNYDIIIPS
ncbi:MAG: hypothetical protein IKN54_07965, partial [Lachnospiraceae bacterium]|nr:hypothetical protein [Lachnospiraceae bacterium]